jgi:hypothetical protein
MKELLYVIACVLFAAAAAIGVVVLFNRYLGAPPKPAPREPSDKEPASPVPATSRPGWWLSLPLVSKRREPAHEGATERWSPLGALAHVGQSPELVPVLTEVQIVAEVHAALDAMMADFRYDLDHILDGVCDRLDPLWRDGVLDEVTA